MKPGGKRHDADPVGAMAGRLPLVKGGLCAVLLFVLQVRAPALEAGFQCAHAAAKPVQRIMEAAPVTGRVHAVALFGRFADEEAHPGNAPPAFADDLFDPGIPGSVTHFYTEMSRGQYEITGSVLPKEYSAAGPASSYISPVEGERGRYAEYVTELIAASDSEIDYSQYDNDGPDGVANSGDDDGIVDFLFVIARSTPPGFIVRGATGIATLGLATGSFRTDDPGAEGGFIRIKNGVTQQGSYFAMAAGNMCHEFAHTLGLPDLYDTDVLLEREEEVPPSLQSAGIGSWGLMGHGALGWGGGGPNPLCAWSLAKLGWLGAANSRLRLLENDAEGLVFEDVNAGGEVVLIRINESRYLLVEHRGRAHSHYERNLPAEGLLVWEIDELALGNNNEDGKRVDLVCADGLFLDAGYPTGTAKGYHIGRDNLDFWSRDEEYNTRFGGNSGDATDLFDGTRFTDFSMVSNPAAPTRISISDIRREGADMVADVRLNDRRRAGYIGAADVWTDTMKLVGDLSIGSDAVVRMLNGTTVLVGEDQRRSGRDPDRCEILLAGDFASISGGGRSRIMPAGPQSPGAWGGFQILASGTLTLRDCDIDYAEKAVWSNDLHGNLELERVTISNTSADGVRIDSDNARINLENLLVKNAGANGVVVTGSAGMVRVGYSRIEGSAASGLVRIGGRLVCVESEFEGNGEETEDAANLVLGRRTQGTVKGNRFSGGTGVLGEGSGEMLIVQNRFEGNRVAVIARSSGISIVDNYFADSELVFQVSGLRVPERLELNAVEGATRLIDNGSPLELLADNNWWGIDDETWIAERISGPVAWRPFLNFDPRVPVAFELEQNFPNPFNASTRIRYTVGIIHASLSHQSEMSLEVRSLTGRLVRRLARAPAAPGIYEAVWDGTDDSGYLAGSGVYYYQFRVGALVLRRKMTLLR